MFFIPSLYSSWYHWLVVESHWPEMLFYGFVMTLTTAISFFGLNLLLLVVEKFNLFSSQRIRRPPSTRPASPEFVREAWMYCLALHVLQIVTVPPLLDLFRQRGTDFNAPITDFSFGTIALHCVFAILVEDFLFYWLHRILHHRSIYKYIHKMHHQFASTVGVSVLWAHPIEVTFAFVIPALAGPYILKTPFSIILFWMTIRVSETVDAHSGYTFKWSPWEMFQSIQGGAERHDFHHSRNIGSFGSFTKFWDWLYGTDKQFNAWLLKKERLVAAEENLQATN
eukprot:m.12225 g.12225  ORF g.12225 m.12225 type:complete len:282 (+) comp7141_c0_seq1:177-1022(+)